MNELLNYYSILMLFGALVTAISQILLKVSANHVKEKKVHFIFEYLNWRVILSYILFFGVLFLNTYAYRGVSFKFGFVISSTSYLWVMLLSHFILKERFTKNKILGNTVIFIGMLVYTFK